MPIFPKVESINFNKHQNQFIVVRQAIPEKYEVGSHYTDYIAHIKSEMIHKISEKLFEDGFINFSMPEKDPHTLQTVIEAKFEYTPVKPNELKFDILEHVEKIISEYRQDSDDLMKIMFANMIEREILPALKKNK